MGLFMKRSVYWSLFLCLTTANSFGQQFEWASSISGLGLDVGRAVATDQQGNVVVVGSFSGSTSIAGTPLNGAGAAEAFVAKLSPTGELLWSRVISGPAEDMARGVVTDHEANVYVVGHFTDTVVFQFTETDTVAARSAGGQDIFVVKYDANGNLLWAVTGGGSGDDTATDIDQHRWTGKLYVSGGFQERARIGLGTVLSNGLTDAFLAKLDMEGNVHWVRNGGGLEHDIASAVAVDPTDGSIYVAGDFYDQAILQGTTLQAMGSSDMFVARYNEQGDLVWARTNGGTSVDVATGIDTDFNGNVFVSGYYQGTTFFGPFSASAISYNDVFLAKFDDEGTCQWFSSAGSWGLDNCLGMATDWDGTTYLTGMFEEEMFAGDVSFEGNGYDIFVLCYESSGDVRYGRKAGAGSSDFGVACALGPNHDLYITGYYYFFAEFDQTTIGPAQNGDGFVAKLNDIVGIDQPSSDHEGCIRHIQATGAVQVVCMETGMWQLFDMLGREARSGSFLSGGLQIPTVPAGMYHLVVSDGSVRASVPVVIP